MTRVPSGHATTIDIVGRSPYLIIYNGWGHVYIVGGENILAARTLPTNIKMSAHITSEIILLVLHDINPMISINGHMISSMIVNIYFKLILLIAYNPFIITTPYAT